MIFRVLSVILLFVLAIISSFTTGKLAAEGKATKTDYIRFFAILIMDVVFIWETFL